MSLMAVLGAASRLAQEWTVKEENTLGTGTYLQMSVTY